MTCIIVGGGAAGFQAAATCRTLWPEHDVTLIDAEKETGYYRTLLPQFIVGALAEEKLFFPKGAEDPLLTVRTGVRVKGLDRAGSRLLIEGGRSPFVRSFDPRPRRGSSSCRAYSPALRPGGFSPSVI